ncbi:hypothetical protein RUM43_000684 [Polyplax serrata]|uniref:Uncharacterized protein n=1 Tax=Polyplax serrata TaxID=468196 RepID=A0AAN8SD48_POLSC
MILSFSQPEVGLHFLDEPKDTVGLKGKSLNILCRPRTTRQRDSFQVVWYHNNKLMDLKNDKRRTVFQNGTLHFSKLVHKKMGHTDQGEYRCVAVKENGALSSKPAFLRISTLPENFSHHPVNQVVEIGSNVELTCDIEFFPDIEIYWEKDNEKLIEDARKYTTISGPDVAGSILYIFNVISEDSGNYRCTAKNVLSNKERHSFYGLLTVIPQKEIPNVKPVTFLSAQHSYSSVPSNIREVREGGNVTLPCVTNHHSNYISGWSYVEQGRNVSRNSHNFTKVGHDVIHLKNVKRQQAGWLTCEAMNLSNKTSNQLRVHLNVLIPPEIQEKPESILFRTSKTVRFRCIAHGNPIPQIYWLKDGNVFNTTGRIKHRSSINESEQVRISELIVASTVANDAGIYQCMVKNSVGSSWAATRLLLNATKPAPGAPEKVTCETVSSSQIKLTWDISNSSSDIKAFTIHYHLTDNGEEMQKVISSDSRSIQIDKLLPFSSYTFYLRLYMDSASEFSEKAICQTGEEVPTDAPEKKISYVSQNSVHISWSPLDKAKARGVVTKYKIQWRSTKSPSSSVVEVVGDVFNYTITGLMPGKKYDVRVLAATNKGFPVTDLPWETFEIPINFNSNIPSPPKITLQAVNSTGIEIKWWPDHEERTKVVGYKIFYRKQNDSKVGPFIVSADENEYVMAGLEPETWYEIMVLGFTETEDGEAGVGFVTTHSIFGNLNKVVPEFPSTPEPPSLLEADPISPVAINLTWSTPQSSSGFTNIKHYTVCFNAVRTGHHKNISVSCIKSLENRISIVGLNPYTLYEFKVRSHDSNNKQSLFSSTMECHTLEGVPSQVTDISWKTINRTAVHVSWKEPRHINGILKGYTLSYTDNYNLPIESWSEKVVPPPTCEIQLTELSSNVKYYFIVRASTNAGFGSYASPKQIFLSSKSSSRNKQTDHYIGIAAGLGIGIFCIIICTTCILCRRRCLKRQVSQEFEATSCRQSNGNVCQRDRECPAESRETEYFTFLSAQMEQPGSLEIGVRNLNSKGNYLNTSGNGIRMSLLNESKLASNGSGKINIYVNETSSFDPLVSEPRTFHNQPHAGSNRSVDHQISKFKRDHLNESRTPLLMRRRKWLTASSPNGSDTNDSEPEIGAKVQRTSFSFATTVDSGKSNHVGKETTQCSEDFDSRKESKAEFRLADGVNNILENPEFRFSSSEVLNKNTNGNLHCNFIYGEFNDVNDTNDKEVVVYGLDCGNYKDSGMFHFATKEIIQES